MRTSFANRPLGAVALALVAAVASGVATGCKDKRKEAPPPPRRDPGPAKVWGGATTDDLVIKWRKLCGTDAVAQRKGAELQINFKRRDGNSAVACTLNYRESNRDLLAATFIVSQTVPPATTYTQWVKAERLGAQLVEELLPEPARAEYNRAMNTKVVGFTELGKGLTLQVVQGTADGMATIVVNVFLKPEAG